MSPKAVNAFLTKYAKELHNEGPSLSEGLHCHVFRYSIGMAMYKAGIPLSYIKDFLGHASINSTLIYAYAGKETMVATPRTVDREALLTTAENGLPDYQPAKKWKGKEDYLLNFCGLG